MTISAGSFNRRKSNLLLAAASGIRRFASSNRGARLLGAKCTVSHPDKETIKVKCGEERYLITIEVVK
jgi:hypothetical protein